MIKKLLTKIIALILAFSSMFALSITAFAEETDKTALAEKVFQNCKTEGPVNKIRSNTLYIDTLGINDVVSEYADALGNRVLIVEEESIVDTVLFTVDGSMLINGGIVTCEYSVDESADYDGSTTRMRTVEYSTSPWFGPASNYSIYISAVQSASVSSGGSLIKDLAVATIAYLLGYALGPSEVFAITVFYTIATQIKSAAQIYAPNSAYLSYSGSKYEHSTQSSSIDRYYKYSVSYYAKANYNQYVGDSTYYEHNYYN